MGVAGSFICLEFMIGTRVGSGYGRALGTAYFLFGAYATRRDKPLIIQTIPLRVLVVVAGIVALASFAIDLAK